MVEDKSATEGLTELGSRTVSVSVQAEPSVGEHTNEDAKRKREDEDSDSGQQRSSSNKRLKSRPSSTSKLSDFRQKEMQETVRLKDDHASLQKVTGADGGTALEKEKLPKTESKKIEKYRKIPDVFVPARQLAEQYVELSSRMMLTSTTHLGPYGHGHEGNNNHHENRSEPTERNYPLELMSSVGFLKSPFRRPMVIERWSPFEISLFEAGIGHYGKDFYQVHKFIQTKSTKEIIDFYYIWKKTSHYKGWKDLYASPAECLSEEDNTATSVKKPMR